MLESLNIENYRCFPSFKLEKFGRVNLLVGKNNSGKTSILECVDFLLDFNTLKSLGEAMILRGEFFSIENVLEANDSQDRKIELDISSLFNQHTFVKNNQISIDGYDHNKEKFERNIKIFEYEKNKEQKDFMEISLKTSVESQDSISLVISARKGIDAAKFFSSNHNGSYELNKKLSLPVDFLRSASLRFQDMLELYDDIILTDEEKIVLEALQCIEPEILQIAPLLSDTFKNSNINAGFVARVKNNPKRVSIGSFGDGIWRMLGIALKLVNVKNGILLVDEIDTGLHYSVMYDMWKLILKTAEKLDIQVFATTHNSDCWKSLAEVAQDEEIGENDVTIHRIEKGATSSVMLNVPQMAIAAKRDLEVR
ncbi:MAG: ATP-binding protein [Limnothrix sp. RL_2_0]|nr:ATP-binding protein [Limnothrix sp. RL_2_0]